MFPDPLRAFQHVVRAGSIRKASERLSVAPSSVSRQVAILERLIGTPLFRRSVGGIALTHAGQLVAEYTDDVLGGFDALRIELNDIRGMSRLLTVAMVESVTSIGPAQAIAAFTRVYPNVTFNFNILPAPAIIDAVLMQRCDVAIGYNMAVDPTILHVCRVAEPVMAVMHADHPLASRDHLSLEDLREETVALQHRDFGIRQMVDRICAEGGYAIHPTLQTNSFEVLRDFARTNGGISILPQRAGWRDRQAGRVAVVALDHPALRESTLDIALLKKERIPRVTRLFANSLADHLVLSE